MMTLWTLEFVCIILTLNLLRSSVSQSVSAAECCSTNLMDATGLVAIETSRILVTSQQTFRAVRIKVCSTDPIAVQIWRRQTDGTYQFRWQTEVTSQMSRTAITINLDAAPLVISPDDRLGVFTPMTSARLAAPFVLQSGAQLYYSATHYSDSNGFTVNTQTNLDTSLVWPRTFNNSVFLCSNSACSDIPTLSTVTVSTQTTTGRPLVSSTTRSGCCPTYPVICDPTDVSNNLNNQTGRVIELQNTINIITKLINDLFTSRQIAGTCPQGFTAGTYGVGKCYVLFRDPVQMALAVLRCRDYFQARLIAIQSVAEEEFLKSLVGNNSIGVGVEGFWTSGMYNRANKAWFWYDESARTRTTQIYTNWEGGTAPTPTTDTDVCSTFTVDSSTKRDFWRKQNCVQSNFYICEIPKVCL